MKTQIRAELRRRGARTSDLDDLTSEVILYLHNPGDDGQPRLSKFDPDRASLATYVTRWVLPNAVRSYFGKGRGEATILSIDGGQVSGAVHAGPILGDRAVAAVCEAYGDACNAVRKEAKSRNGKAKIGPVVEAQVEDLIEYAQALDAGAEPRVSLRDHRALYETLRQRGVPISLRTVQRNALRFAYVEVPKYADQTYGDGTRTNEQERYERLFWEAFVASAERRGITPEELREASLLPPDYPLT